MEISHAWTGTELNAQDENIFQLVLGSEIVLNNIKLPAYKQIQ